MCEHGKFWHTALKSVIYLLFVSHFANLRWVQV